MCTNPSTKDGKTFACRNCNACVGARWAGWVSRAMAESAMHPHTLAITLTYGDETQEQRDGAAMFRYRDIEDLLRRLRRQIHYRTGKHSQLRYLVAGEQGDRKGRCHWHLVLFSQYEILDLGDWYAAFGKITRRDQKISTGSRYKNCKWSLWPHGMVVVQEPDQQGISYAIGYALKDQFAIDRAKGTARELKADTYAASMFRMSKKPPIGWTFLQRYLSELWENQNIPPSLKITVPDSTLQWYPTGAVRRMLLETIKQINDRIRADTGRNAPQWSTLVHMLKDNVKDMEILLDGEEDEDDESAEFSIRKRAKEAEHDHARKKGLRRCGSTVACNSCLRNLSNLQLQRIGAEPYTTNDGQTRFREKGEQDGATLRKKQGDAANGGINRYCGLQGTSYTAEIFGARNRSPETTEPE